jgi:hypothetical protein
LVLPIPLEQMRAQIDSADIKPLNPNELAHLSEEEVRRYLASRAGKPTAAQNYQASTNGSSPSTPAFGS